MTRESKSLNANANANAKVDSGAAKYAAPDREGRAPRPSDGSNPRNASEKVSTHGGGKRGSSAGAGEVMKTLALDSLEEVREETGLETESGGSGYDGDGDTRRRRDGRRAAEKK